MELRQAGIYLRGIIGNINNYLSKTLEKEGIGYGQFEYFMYIASYEGINQNELAKMKHVGKPSVAKAIKILEAEGYIYREIDPDDRRNYQLYCTEKGKESIQKFSSQQDMLKQIVFQDFTNEEVDELMRLLGKLYKSTGNLSKIDSLFD